tara:strand:- start:840 stop:1832 length:993 start_codon:yes stop_codon:yes gene_type:complete
MLKMSWKKSFEKYAKKQAPEEACGLLAIIDGKETFWPCKNLAEGKLEFFVIDPDDWAECEDTGQVIGVVHSHPKGGSTPSELDVKACEQLGFPYFIYSLLDDDWQTFEPSDWKGSIIYNDNKVEESKDTNFKTIKVYGKLRQFLGKSYFKAAVKSPQQALSFLIANFEGLQKHMNDQVYRIKMGGREITEDYLSMSGQGEIQIIPIAHGGIFGFLAGLVFSGFAAETGAFIAGIVGSQLLGTAVTAALSTIGTSMIIGGITELISPQNTPQNASSVSDIDPKMRGSYSFSGIQNVSTSGVPVPILYGLVFSGSILISSGTDTAQIRKSLS